MNKLELKYFPYTLKLTEPFNTSEGQINERHGLIIKLSGKSGISGIGDTAPFPEFGSESLEDSVRTLENLNLEIKIDLDNILKSLDSVLRDFKDFPSLRHGLEQALLNLICKEKKITLNYLLGRKSLKIIDVNAVLGILPPEKLVQSARKYFNDGFSTLKLKIGRTSFNEDLECIKELKKISRNLKIRLDVNGKWNLDGAKENIEKLEPYELEFIEQPVKSLNEFIKLKESTVIPLAADESVRSIEDADEFIRKKAAAILVLKPMMIGGIIPTLRIIDQASENGIKTVISSSFESAVGKSFAVFTASLIRENIAHGLSAAAYFEKDIFEDPYPVKNGKIFL